MKKKFQHEDFQYLYKMARNSKGEEKKRKEDIIKFAEACIKQKEERNKNWQENALKRAERFASVQLIFNKDDLDKLKSQKLQDHVEAFINAGASGFEGIKTKTKVGEKREALKKAIDAKEKGIWIPKLCKMVTVILIVTQEDHLRVWMSFKIAGRVIGSPQMIQMNYQI